jgi:hypothetical protein
MSEQPYPLQLAEELESFPLLAADKAAAELRRLHQESTELRRTTTPFRALDYIKTEEELELYVAAVHERMSKRITELEGVMVRARNVLDAGVKISPESVIHDDLRAALSKALEGKA